MLFAMAMGKERERERERERELWPCKNVEGGTQWMTFKKISKYVKRIETLHFVGCLK